MKKEKKSKKDSKEAFTKWNEIDLSEVKFCYYKGYLI